MYIHELVKYFSKCSSVLLWFAVEIYLLETEGGTPFDAIPAKGKARVVYFTN
jgi:hypothetical protein